MTTPITLPGTNRFKGYDLDHLGNWKKSPYIPAPGSGSSSSSSESGDEPALEMDRRDHNALNQITRRKATSGGEWTTFSYDKNGNLLDDGQRLMEYDAFNRLCRVTRKSDDAIVGQYFYDANPARRIRKIVSNNGINNDLPPEANGTTDFIYYPGTWQDAEDRITPDCSETSSFSTAPCSLSTKHYIWGHYIDDLIQQRDENDSGITDFYSLRNPLYTATALTDEAADIVEAYDTDAYGNTLIFNAPGTGGNWWGDDAITGNNTICNVLFGGYYYGQEAVVFYVRRRAYDPRLARWLQNDPLAYTRTLTRIEYVGSNPLIRLDPSGLDFIAVASRKVALWYGHYSLEYWKSDCPGPDGWPTVPEWKQLNPRASRLQAVELLNDITYQVWTSGPEGFPFSATTADSFVSFLLLGIDGIAVVYFGSEYRKTSANRDHERHFTAIFDSFGRHRGSDEEVRRKWGQVLAQAAFYEWAEYAGTAVDPPGNVQRWPKSKYSSFGTNSNVFVREMAHHAGLQMKEYTRRSHPPAPGFIPRQNPVPQGWLSDPWNPGYDGTAPPQPESR